MPVSVRDLYCCRSITWLLAAGRVTCTCNHMSHSLQLLGHPSFLHVAQLLQYHLKCHLTGISFLCGGHITACDHSVLRGQACQQDNGLCTINNDHNDGQCMSNSDHKNTSLHNIHHYCWVTKGLREETEAWQSTHSQCKLPNEELDLSLLVANSLTNNIMGLRYPGILVCSPVQAKTDSCGL